MEDTSNATTAHIGALKRVTGERVTDSDGESDNGSSDSKQEVKPSVLPRAQRIRTTPRYLEDYAQQKQNKKGVPIIH